MSRTCVWFVALCAVACAPRSGSQPAKTTAVADPAAVKRLTDQGHTLDLAAKHDEAVASFQAALALDPQSYAAHYGLGRALDLAGRYDQARAEFTTAIPLAPATEKDQATRMLGISWMFTGDADHAAPYFKAVFDRQMAARSFDGAADVANELGRVYLELGRLDDAAKWYGAGHDAAGQESGRPQWRIDLADMRWAHAQARIAARRGQAAEARRQETAFTRLLDKGGNDDQKIQLPYLLGYDDFYLGRYRSAIAHLDKADQKDPLILCLIAQSYEKLGEVARARTYYEQVIASSSHAIAAAAARPVALSKLASSGVRRD